mmetsp:Transcript_39744/g.64521  ORF Transcript_39744/g.64521 Transcript_39744/m.64521 type:complete len:372 (-) Transcript_39744:1015-2130(-)
MDALRDLEQRLSAAVAETSSFGIDASLDGDVEKVGMDTGKDRPPDADKANDQLNGDSAHKVYSTTNAKAAPTGLTTEGHKLEPSVEEKKNNSAKKSLATLQLPTHSNSTTSPKASLSRTVPGQFTLDDFRNSSHRSARSAIDALLTSERVLRPLRLLVLQSYIRNADKFSMNLGELLSELAEEEQQRIKDGKNNTNSVSQYDGDPDSYYLQVDMLEVELANLISTCTLFVNEDSTPSEAEKHPESIFKNANGLADKLASETTSLKKTKKKKKKKREGPPETRRDDDLFSQTLIKLENADDLETNQWASLETFYQYQRDERSPPISPVRVVTQNPGKVKKKKKTRKGQKGLARLTRETVSSKASKYTKTANS